MRAAAQHLPGWGCLRAIASGSGVSVLPSRACVLEPAAHSASASISLHLVAMRHATRGGGFGAGSGRVGAQRRRPCACIGRAIQGGWRHAAERCCRMAVTPSQARRRARPTTACDVVLAAVDSTKTGWTASALRTHGLTAAARLCALILAMLSRMTACPVRTVSEHDGAPRRCRRPTIAGLLLLRQCLLATVGCICARR